MTLFDQISKDIVAAMKAKTAPGANDELTDEAAMKILSKLTKQGKDTAALYVSQNREDLANEELAQVAVIESYLPAPLSEEELRIEIQKIIEQTGATSAKEMGKVMGVATKSLAGKADGKAISALVKELLS